MRLIQSSLAVVAFAGAVFGCSSEPAAVKNAYELMAKHMCREAIAPLKAALAEHPDDARIPKALCEASICLTWQGGRDPEVPSASELKNYCELGLGTAPAPSDVVIKALALSSIAETKEGDIPTALSEAAATTKDDGLRWYAAYSFAQGSHWPLGPQSDRAKRPRVTVSAASLGDVLAHEENCTATPDKAARAIVRRGGAKVLRPGTGTVEAELTPGESFTVKSAKADRVRFVDSVREHWKPATGWIVLRSENNVMNGAFRPNPGMPPQVPLDPNYVTRSVPGIATWDGLGNDRSGCRDPTYHYVACLGERIPMRPGSLKYGNRTEERTSTLSYGAPGQNIARTVYRAVTFEERDTPEREVATESVYLLGPQCPIGPALELLTEYPEWEEGVIEAMLKGEIRKGMPAFAIALRGWQPKELVFDRSGFAIVWHEEDGKNHDLSVRNGRVDSVK